MSSYDVLTVANPLKEDFTHSWDGEPITIPAGKKKSLQKNLALHMAKHLAKYILIHEKGLFADKEVNGVRKHKAVPITTVEQAVEELIERPEEEDTEIEVPEVNAPIIKEEKKEEEKEESKGGLETLRAEYESLFGKKPFMGWKEDKLKEKIEEKK